MWLEHWFRPKIKYLKQFRGITLVIDEQQHQERERKLNKRENEKKEVRSRWILNKNSHFLKNIFFQ